MGPEPIPDRDVVALRWAVLPRAAWLAAQGFGHRSRHLRGGGLLTRVGRSTRDWLMLFVGVVLYPGLFVGYRLVPGHRVYVTVDERAVAHVATWRPRGRWVVTDVAAWPYGGGAGDRLVRGLQRVAATDGASLHLKAGNARLVDRFYLPLGFTVGARRHWLSWDPRAVGGSPVEL